MTSAGVTTTSIDRRARKVRFRIQSAIRNSQSAIAALALLIATLTLAPGCARPPGIIPAELRKPIDRSLVEYPANTQLERYISNLTAPTAIAFDAEKNLVLVAESGAGGTEPRILAFNYVDGTTKTVYPQGKVFGPFRSIPFRMYGPIGGMAVYKGVIYVSHRDKDDFGVISAVSYDGKGKTIIAGLPAQGDYGITDLAFDSRGRLYFCVGSATNSGVVGLDNMKTGWPQQHPNVADKPYVPSGAPDQSIQLRGARFFTSDPRAGLFSETERAVTAPYQPFGQFQRSRISAAADGKPNSAIFSLDASGGIAQDLQVEVYSIHLPSGLAFLPDPEIPFATNEGMEARGTRPVWNDPDVVLRLPPRGKGFGFPDFTTDLHSVSESTYQPPNPELIRQTGYTELAPLVDHFSPPTSSDRDDYVRGVFPSMSGASKMAFVPEASPLREFRRQLVVAMIGPRTPFASDRSPFPLKSPPPGHKVVRLDAEGGQKVIYDMIRNTAGVPRSMTKANKPELLERPIDVKFGPDGYMYVLDFGRADYRTGRPNVTARTGQVFRMLPGGVPSTGPTLKNVDVPGTE
jgi:glucose/arabinose dehydrogenase